MWLWKQGGFVVYISNPPPTAQAALFLSSPKRYSLQPFFYVPNRTKPTSVTLCKNQNPNPFKMKIAVIAALAGLALADADWSDWEQATSTSVIPVAPIETTATTTTTTTTPVWSDCEFGGN